MIKVEIACNSIQSCLNAKKAGAHRIELFENLSEGGCTPSAGTIRKSLEIDLPVYIMIRPRGGHFVYSNDEIDTMLWDVEFCKVMGVKGIVFGCLNEHGSVDKELCKRILNIWNGPATFHRAIDRSKDILESCKTIIDLGFERILSSGGETNVIKGLHTLKTMNSQFGSLISIMPGAGVNKENARKVVEETHCREIHSTCKVTRPSKTGSANINFDDTLNLSDENEIRQLISELN